MEFGCKSHGIFRFEFAIDSEMGMLLNVQDELAEIMWHKVSRDSL